MPRAPQKRLEMDELVAYAGRTLAARAQTSSELREKLKRRALRETDVDLVIARLKDAGYLNDHRFAESFAHWRRDNDGFGKARVMHDLMNRRVAPAVARKAADDAFKETDETAMIEQFLARKYRGKNLGTLLQEDKSLASAFRRLRAAGFSVGNSIRVLKRYAAEADRLEEMEQPGEG
jgi:regulatory protein